MKKLSKLKGVKALNKKEQKVVYGGDFPFYNPIYCGCIVMTPYGYLEIITVRCDETCPDGSTPDPRYGP